MLHGEGLDFKRSVKNSHLIDISIISIEGTNNDIDK